MTKWGVSTAWFALAVCLGVTLAGEAGETSAETALRDRLLRAHRAASSMHLALHWQVTVQEKTSNVVTEVFRSGDLAGLRCYRRDTGKELVLTLTDGLSYWGASGGSVHLCTEGVKAIRHYMAPYEDACRFLAKLWEVGPPVDSDFETTFSLNHDESAGDFNFGLRIAPGGVPSWLSPTFLAKCAVQEVAASGRVELRGDGFSIELDSGDGMPVYWKYEDKDRAVTATRTDPAWSVERWSGVIHERAAECEANENWRSTCGLADRGLGTSLIWFVEAFPQEQLRTDKLWLFATTCAGVDLHANRFRLRSLANGADASAGSDQGPPLLADTPKLSAQVEAKVIDTVRACARERGWALDGAELESITRTLRFAYRTCMFAQEDSR